MSDIIFRQDAIDAIMGEYPEPHYPDWFADVVARVPSAQPQRKMGKWIYGNDFHWYTASCNKCGYTRKTDIKATRWNEWKFCPSCGADMRGDHNA